MSIQNYFKITKISVLSSLHQQNLPLIRFQPDELQMFSLKGWRQRNRSTINRTINSRDYVPHLTSFAVSHDCEILHSEFQRCLICDSMWIVGHAKDDLTSHGRDFQKQAARALHKHKVSKISFAVVADLFTAIITRIAWYTRVRVWAKLRRENSPWTKQGGWPHQWDGAIEHTRKWMSKGDCINYEQGT